MLRVEVRVEVVWKLRVEVPCGSSVWKLVRVEVGANEIQTCT